MAQVVQGLTATEVQAISDTLAAWRAESRGWSPWIMEVDEIDDPRDPENHGSVSVALRLTGSEDAILLVVRDEKGVGLINLRDQSRDDLTDIETGMAMVRENYLLH